MKIIAIVVVAVLASSATIASQDEADAWTAIQFTVPIPRPHSEATVSARATGEGCAIRITELTITYRKTKVRVPTELLQRLANPDLSTMNLYHPTKPFDAHYYLTLSFEFGDASDEEPFDFPEASFSIVDGKVVALAVDGDLPEEELNKLQWSKNGN